MRMSDRALGHCGTLLATSPGELGLSEPPHSKGTVMLYWAAVFFVIALAAAVLGFGGIAAGAAGIAKVLFFVFLILGALSLIFGRRVPA